MVSGSLMILRLLPPLKFVTMLKVALNAINQIKSNPGGFVYIVPCNWCIYWVTVTLTHISAEDGVYSRDNIILQRVN